MFTDDPTENTKSDSGCLKEKSIPHETYKSANII